jgi:hypothetical protein
LVLSLPACCICGHLGARAWSIMRAQALQSDLPARQRRQPHSGRSFRVAMTIISHRGLRAASRLSRSLPRYAACARALHRNSTASIRKWSAATRLRARVFGSCESKLSSSALLLEKFDFLLKVDHEAPLLIWGESATGLSVTDRCLGPGGDGYC